jgi:hypothetical protein
MNSARILGGNAFGVVMIAGLYLVSGSVEALAARATSYDISDFQCDEEKTVGEIAELTVKVRKRGPPGSGTELSVSGEQSGQGTVLDETILILDSRREKKAENTFLYSIVSPGTIEWSATVDGDEARCTTIVVDGGGGGGGGGSDWDNIVALHDSASPQYEEHCLECHTDVFAEQSLDPAIPGAHVAMRAHVPGKDDETKCTWCHRSVDLVQGTRSAENAFGNLRKRVDVTLCTLCHGQPPRSTAKLFYQTGLSPTNPDGAVLYDVACAACHDDLAQSEVKDESAAEIEAKISANKGGMGPLEILTPEEIQAIANVLAQ